MTIKLKKHSKANSLFIQDQKVSQIKPNLFVYPHYFSSSLFKKRRDGARLFMFLSIFPSHALSKSVDT